MSLNYNPDYNREIRAWLLRVRDYAKALAKHPLERRSCPVCQSGKSEVFANNDYLDYERCSDCSLVYMNPAPTAEAIHQGFKGDDELLMDYFQIAKKHKNGSSARPDPTTDHKLADIYRLKPSGRLLDVGCSVGDFLHKAKHFYQVEGVEINPVTSVIAAQHFTVHACELAALNVGASFDVVTLNQILYGIADPVQLMRDIQGVIRKDGIVYVNTPNADSHAMKFFNGKANHLYGYTARNVFNRCSLQALARLTGFRVLTFRTEWLDIYATDVVEFFEHPDEFIHKRNCHIADYERKIRAEDELHRSIGLNLGDHGNYLVAVLGKETAGV